MKTARILLISNPSLFKPRDTAADTQPQFRVETKRLPKATASTFYRKLDETLGQIGFTEGLREICQPAYADASKGGRPGMPLTGSNLDRTTHTPAGYADAWIVPQLGCGCFSTGC